MSERALRCTAELALVGIAAVWGVTFVMVQKAIALLPTLAFLAYRFVPAALLVALVFLRAVLIMAAIVAVEAMPRFRPPRPLPEG
jgi:hypothetical protein